MVQYLSGTDVAMGVAITCPLTDVGGPGFRQYRTVFIRIIHAVKLEARNAATQTLCDAPSDARLSHAL